MRKRTTSISSVICIILIGALLGTVFTFGVKYWNDEVTKDSCEVIQTEFLSFRERKQTKPSRVVEIMIDCANGQRYFIDGACLNDQLYDSLSQISSNDTITLWIHPNSGTIVEMKTKSGPVLVFEDTMKNLNRETTGFFILGILMYGISFIGLCYIICYGIRRRRRKNN